MTCIIGIAQEGKVYIGADSLGVNDNGGTLINADKKVFRNKDFLIGRCGSLRMGQIMRYCFTPPDYEKLPVGDPGYLFCYMVAGFAREMKECFDRLDYKEEEKGSILVGFQGRLFEVSADNFQVEEEVRGYNAIGIGADIAKGSLYTTHGMDMSPEKRIEMALYASEKHNANVRHPFVIESI